MMRIASIELAKRLSENETLSTRSIIDSYRITGMNIHVQVNDCIGHTSTYIYNGSNKGSINYPSTKL